MDPFLADYVERLADLHQQMTAVLTDLPSAVLDWVPPAPEANSLSVLASHTAGALLYWAAEVPLDTPSARIRADEFATHGRTSADLVAALSAAHAAVQAACATLTTADLAAERRPSRHAHLTCTVAWALLHAHLTCTVAWALLHALEHTASHVGHMQLTKLWAIQNGVVE